MKSIKLVLPIFLLLVTFMANAAITLKDAWLSAIAQTETIPVSQSRIHQADARVDQARSKFFPTLSLGANFQRQDSDEGKNFFDKGQSYSRFTLSQSIYEGGKDRATLESSKAARASQEYNLDFAKSNIFATVARSFYAILSGEQERQNLKKIISLAGNRTKEIKYRTKIGKSRNVELLAAQAQLSVLESQLMAVEGQLATARDQFSMITGLNPYASLVDGVEKLSFADSLQNWLVLMEKRHDIQSLKAQVESAQSDVGVARSGHLPSINLTGNYYLSRKGSQEDNNWDAGVALTVPLFSGGVVSAKVREVREREVELELLLAQTRRQAEIEIRTAYNNVTSATNQIKALTSALTLTEQNYKEQEKNYGFGQATNLDVIQALNTFQDVKRTLDRTRFQALSFMAELKAATSQLP